jgi:hypothetical protein
MCCGERVESVPVSQHKLAIGLRWNGRIENNNIHHFTQLSPSPVPDTRLPFNGSTSSISLPSVLSKSEPYLFEHPCMLFRGTGKTGKLRVLVCRSINSDFEMFG